MAASRPDRLRELLREATPGHRDRCGGKRLLVQGQVPAPRSAGTCRITAQGLLRKGRPATEQADGPACAAARRSWSCCGSSRRRGSKVAKRKRLLVRQKVRAGKVAATLVKSRKLIRR